MSDTGPAIGEVSLGAPRNGLSRVRVEAERYDLAYAWMTAEVLGAITISVFRGFDHPIWRMAAPLAFMAGYLLFAYSRSQFSTARVADSVYFMGFWWTLWALINVLLSPGQLTAAKLYETFGYALITTAAGMFARLALLQFYRTLEDQEDQAVDQIDQRVTNLIGELELSQQAVASLRATGALALEQWHNKFLTASDQIVCDVKQMADNLTMEGENLNASVKTLHQSLSSVGRLLTTFEKRLGTSVESTVKRFESIEIPPDLLRSKLNEVLALVERSVTPVADLAASTLAQLNKALLEVGKGVTDFPKSEHLQQAVLDVTKKLDLVTEACSRLAYEAGVTQNALSSVGAGATSLLGNIEGASEGVNDLRKRLESLRSVVEAADGNTQKVSSTVKEVVRFVQAELGSR
jgi:methyl-accepting chemotaxis protein